MKSSFAITVLYLAIFVMALVPTDAKLTGVRGDGPSEHAEVRLLGEDSMPAMKKNKKKNKKNKKKNKKNKKKVTKKKKKSSKSEKSPKSKSSKSKKNGAHD
jgi:hypothetical protein